ncbi:protein TWIN LOV 1 isoform X3 [Capsicum annuum]|uniref:protein TWIN LOV 1 isoform X3 n=1 Tax=Capsicum annuum TaxID=4072 RepID=UPI0007BEF6FC|nr:protein TWIN LOV 1 isoform X3 [Capsicum annuum]
MPIVFASDTFLKLTGFSKDEVLGYNCRSLSVINTDSSSQFCMKECIQNELPRTVRMYYRKDGTSFWLHISPVRNASGKVKKLEIGALVFISGVVRVKILKFEQARIRHGWSCF